jgi:hypothetical protein
MNDHISVLEAALIMGHDEKSIRNWLKSGRLKTDPGMAEQIRVVDLVGLPIKRKFTLADAQKVLRRRPRS